MFFKTNQEAFKWIWQTENRKCLIDEEEWFESDVLQDLVPSTVWLPLRASSWWKKTRKVKLCTCVCGRLCVCVLLLSSLSCRRCCPRVLQEKEKQQVIVKSSCGRSDFTAQPSGSTVGRPHGRSTRLTRWWTVLGVISMESLISWKCSRKSQTCAIARVTAGEISSTLTSS